MPHELFSAKSDVNACEDEGWAGRRPEDAGPRGIWGATAVALRALTV